jgi:hypothetical protein
MLDFLGIVAYIVYYGAEKQGWPLSREEDSASLTPRTDPEGRPPAKVALLAGRGQEDRRS